MIISMCCIVFFFLTTTFFGDRIREPHPASPQEITKLKSVSLRLVQDSGRSLASQVMDSAFIEQESKGLNLRIYAKFAGLCEIPALNILIAGVRYRYVYLKSNLHTDNLTEEHVKVFARFGALERDEWSIIGDDEAKKKHEQFQKTVFYALDHLGPKAEAIFVIVRDRGVIDLKSVKKLMKDLDSVPAGALSEGML